MNTTIPFAGFYESYHSHNIDRELESLFDHEGSGDVEVPDEMWSEVDFRKVHLAYSQEYLTAFQSWLEGETHLKIEFKFEAVDSPREYNFTTDRIFAELTRKEFFTLYGFVMSEHEEGFEVFARKRFTSRDGFISSYDPDIDDWGPPREWDHNQVGTILDFLAEEYGLEEHYIVEDLSGNGDIHNMLCDAMTPRGLEILNEKEVTE